MIEKNVRIHFSNAYRDKEHQVYGTLIVLYYLGRGESCMRRIKCNLRAKHRDQVSYFEAYIYVYM